MLWAAATALNTALGIAKKVKPLTFAVVFEALGRGMASQVEILNVKVPGFSVKPLSALAMI